MTIPGRAWWLTAAVLAMSSAAAFAQVALRNTLQPRVPNPLHADARVAGQTQPSRSPWQMEPSETNADLRGVHAAGGGVVWASGTGGTVLRSEDSGFEWQVCAMPPGAEKLDFRAVWGFDDQTAIVMSSGPGALSRLYKTTDGCAHWTALFSNPDEDGFWDALAFVDAKQGYLLGDPVQAAGRTSKEFQLFVTHDGGRTWGRQTEDFYDEMGTTDGAGAFAASNSALCVLGHHLWFGSGGKPGAFVFVGDRYANAPAHTFCDFFPPPADEIWVTHRVPVPMAGGSDAAGIFSLAFRDGMHGVAVGGDYSQPALRAGTAAWTSDGGRHWTAATTMPGGYRSAAAYDAGLKAWIAAGPNGSDISRDEGRNWQPLEHAAADAPKGGEWNALSLPWVVGPHGRIAKLDAALVKR